MTLSADTTAAHVVDANATSVTLTPAANSLLVVFAAADDGTGSTDEELTVTATGLTWTLAVRANGTTDGTGNGSTVEIWTAPQASSASRTINVTDNKGSKPKAVKVVVFTSDTGNIPAPGGTATEPSPGTGRSELTVAAAAAGAWLWGAGIADANFGAVDGMTLQDHVDTSGGFDGGDSFGVYSADTLATTGGDDLVVVNSRATFHSAALAIEEGSAGGGTDHAGAVTPTVTASLTPAATHTRAAAVTGTATAALAAAPTHVRAAAVSATATASLTPTPTHVRAAAVTATATAGLDTSTTHTRASAATATAHPSVALSAAGQNTAAITATVTAALAAAFTAIRNAAVSALVTARLVATRHGSQRDLEYTTGPPQVDWTTRAPTLGWDDDPPRTGWHTRPPST